MLALYNVINLFGWGHVLYSLVSGVMGGGVEYHELISIVSVVQCGAIMEPVMIMMGKVKSPLAAALIQLASRLIFPFWFFYAFDHDVFDTNVQMRVALCVMCFAWSVTEITRSAFYVTKWHYVTLLRYNLFVVLYPLGVFGELLFIVSTTSLTSDPTTRLLYMLLCGTYGVFFPMLYIYMFRQRTKMYKNLRKKQS